jgi:hypothetical protein
MIKQTTTGLGINGMGKDGSRAIGITLPVDSSVLGIRRAAVFSELSDGTDSGEPPDCGHLLERITVVLEFQNVPQEVLNSGKVDCTSALGTGIPR